VCKNLTLTDAEQADLAKPLTEEEIERFAELEEIVEHGRQTYFAVGRALAEIRDRKLYRKENFATFDDYCRVRWQYTGGHARRLIRSSEVAGVLVENVPIGTVLRSESQIRPFLEFPIEDIPVVFSTVKEDLGTSNGQSILTARKIAGVIQRRKVAATAGPFYKRKLSERREKRKQREQQEERMPRHASNGNGEPDRSERFNLDRALARVREFLHDQAFLHWPPEHHTALACAIRQAADEIEHDAKE